jgi:hypothetical protein
MDRFVYGKAKYVNSNIKVCIICHIHGEFWQKPNKHMNGRGCPKCGVIARSDKSRLPLDSFIAKSQQSHGNKYDYSKVEYKNCSTKVCIVCYEHGDFWQTPGNHMNGHGCDECGGTATLTTEKFIAKAKSVHGSNYDYDKVELKGSNAQICIICPIHGEFLQTPADHLYGRGVGAGCPECGRISTTVKRRLTWEKFLGRSRQEHGNKYNYDNLDWQKYQNNATKIIIVCPDHGAFKQTPGNHMNGHGCPTCRESNGEKFIREYLNEHDIKHQPQYRLDYGDGKYGKVDFFVETERGKVGIEFHGEQHYFPCGFGSRKTNPNLSLFDCLKRDEIKERWFYENNIPLWLIPYWSVCHKGTRNRSRKKVNKILNKLFAGKEVISKSPPEVCISNDCWIVSDILYQG